MLGLLMNKNEALAAISEIESLIERFGSPDEQALRRIKALTLGLEGDNNYFNEKLGELRNWATIGFTTRKFLKHGGIKQVSGHARTDCMLLRRLINKWPDSLPGISE